MTPAIVGAIALAVLGVLLTALFAGIETGIYTLNRISLAVRVGRRERSAAILDAELVRPDRVIATLLIGNNIAHYLSGLGIATVLDTLGFGPVESVVINLAVLLPVIFVLAETLPKDLFRTYTDVWTYVFARYLRAWRLLLTVVPLVPTVTFIGTVMKRFMGGGEQGGLPEPRQRIAKLIREGVQAGVLSERQTSLAARALSIREVTVGGEMTAWNRVTVVPLDASPEARRAIIARSGASRFPVVQGGGPGGGRVVGILSALDAILEPGQATSVLMRPAVVFAPSEPAFAALRTLRSTRNRLAVVANPATGQPLGVIAIKDLVEPVTGSIELPGRAAT